MREEGSLEMLDIKKSRQIKSFSKLWKCLGGTNSAQQGLGNKIYHNSIIIIIKILSYYYNFHNDSMLCPSRTNNSYKQ